MTSVAELDYVWVALFLHETTRLRIDEVQARDIVTLSERKLRDLFDVAADNAVANGRAVILWHDLPMTKGLRATIQEYEGYSRDLPAATIEAYLRDVGILTRFDDHVRAALPRLFGTLLFLTGRVIALMAPRGSSEFERLAWLTRTEEEWPSQGELERAVRVIDLAL